MKNYICYVNGIEQADYIKAANHNAAERKAKKKYPLAIHVQVVYTEI
jgi:hypothetical protein